jgi:8-oxo-dGTP diphosphatase
MNVRPSAIIIRDNSILTLCYCYGQTEVYGLPGGNPDPGESLSEALFRELEEEIQIEVNIGEMICCGEVIWPQVKKETLHMVFEATISSGEPKLNPEHTTALRIVWLPIDTLSDNLLYPNVGEQITNFYRDELARPHIGVIRQPYIAS